MRPELGVALEGPAVADACLLSRSLHPGDLFPFTRKPLFIVVDSSNSTAYKVPRKRHQWPKAAV